MEAKEKSEQRPYTRTYAVIDLDAVEANIKALKAVLGKQTAMMAVVKADGYGHGAAAVAKAAEPYVKMYGVAAFEEAVSLQRHGITKPILVLGVVHKRHDKDMVDRGIRSTVFLREQAESLSETAIRLGKTAYVHLALDTGMSRIGMSPSRESAKLAAEMSRLPGICVEGLFTHFARADEGDKQPALNQLRTYLGFVQLLKEQGVAIPVKHISNSAGIVDLREGDLDMVRAGISLYGMYPSDEVDKDRVRLKPVMGWKSCIVCIRDIGPGTAVSYGGTFVADKPVKVATIPVGYGDGYPRALSGKGQVIIRGKRAPILGRVCMDQMMVDVTDIPDAEPDDEVTLLGRSGDQEITAKELARLFGGFHYELVCGVGKRVPRVYIKNGNVVGTKDCFSD